MKKYVIGIDEVGRAARRPALTKRKRDGRASPIVIGIDEVGRGALAGPVVVAAALLKTPGVFGGDCELGKRRIKDSKKLSSKQRETWFNYFKNNSDIQFAVARVYPRRIEKMNISRAANLAALRAYKKLIASSKLSIMKQKLLANSFKLTSKEIADIQIFLDGGLFLGNGVQPKNAKTVIKGDEKIPAVAIASIIAKVHRDHFMVRLAKKYPAYGFETHKGYGTKRHYKALRKYGWCDVHRKTFL
jgi:ribonuclease HII